MKFFKTPFIFKILFPSILFSIKTKSKIIYLTFDDGPNEIVTPFVLDELLKFNAKATFFCIGQNARKHPKICNDIIQNGHKIANHTENHLKGFKISESLMEEEIKSCDISISHFSISSLFRPPYGQLTLKQFIGIRKFKKIVLWDVLTYDFESDISSEHILKNAIKNTQKGSIIVFHDSLKASKNLYFVLPQYLKHFSDLGYQFEILPN